MAKVPTLAEMEKRVARFEKLTPHPVTFLDQALPENKRVLQYHGPHAWRGQDGFGAFVRYP